MQSGQTGLEFWRGVKVSFYINLSHIALTVPCFPVVAVEWFLPRLMDFVDSSVKCAENVLKMC